MLRMYVCVNERDRVESENVQSLIFIYNTAVIKKKSQKPRLEQSDIKP